MSTTPDTQAAEKDVSPLRADRRPMGRDLARILVVWLVLVAVTLGALWLIGRSGSRILSNLAYTSPSAWELADVYRLDGLEQWRQCLERVNATRQPGKRLEDAVGILKGDPQLQQAEANLLKAYELNPYQHDVPGVLSDLALWDGRIAEAYAWRGVQSALRKQWDVALTAFETAKRTEEAPTAQIEEGRLEALIRLERWEEAEEAAQAMEGKGYLTSKYYRLLSDIRRKHGDKPGEETALRQAVQMDPTDVDSVFQLDTLLVQSGRVAEAYDVIAAASTVVSNSGRLWHRRAKLAIYLGRKAEAVDYYRAALKAQPNSFVLHMELAQLYLELGDKHRAKPHLNRALELDPDAFRRESAKGS